MKPKCFRATVAFGECPVEGTVISLSEVICVRSHVEE